MREDPQEYFVGNNRFAVLNTISKNRHDNYDHTYANVTAEGKRCSPHNIYRNTGSPIQSRSETRTPMHNSDKLLDPRKDIFINHNGRLPSDSSKGLAYINIQDNLIRKLQEIPYRSQT